MHPAEREKPYGTRFFWIRKTLTFVSRSASFYVKELLCFAVLPGHTAHAAVDHDRMPAVPGGRPHAKVSPFFAAVMRLYCVPLPVRMLTVPLTQECIDRADVVTVLSHEYTKSCLFARNRYLVTQVDILLACFDGKEGGTKNTVEYAQRNGCRVCLIPPVKKVCRKAAI